MIVWSVPTYLLYFLPFSKYEWIKRYQWPKFLNFLLNQLLIDFFKSKSLLYEFLHFSSRFDLVMTFDSVKLLQEEALADLLQAYFAVSAVGDNDFLLILISSTDFVIYF